MKMLILNFSALFILSFHLQAQDLTQEQVREDFEYFNNALKEGHPGLYWYDSEENLQEAIQNVQASFSTVKEVTTLHSSLVGIINEISDGHSAVLLPEAYYHNVDSVNLFIPFNIVLIEDKVIVSESFTPALSRGDQILTIDGKPTKETVIWLQRFIPVDKGIQSKRARSIELVFPYYYALYLKQPTGFTIEYINAKGKKMIDKVAAIGRNARMYKSVRDFSLAHIPLEWRLDKKNHSAIIKLASFGPQSFKKYQINFKDTIKAIFEKLHKENIENLIIDLRWNNGGNMRFAEYLFSFFIDSTYLYYIDAEIKQSVMEGTTKYVRSRNMLPMIAKQFGGDLEPKDGVYYLAGEKSLVVPASPRFKGQLYLITNGFSFSATSAFIAHIQENNIGQIVGETPGGAYDGVNAGPIMLAVLPNSKIRLFYRTIGSRYSVDEGKMRAVVDVPLDNTLESFINGKDVQMEYVLDLIKK